MREEHAAAAEYRRRVFEEWCRTRRFDHTKEEIAEIAEENRRRKQGIATCATCRYFDGRPRRVVREAEPEASELAPASVGFEVTLEPPEEGKCRLQGPVVLGWPTVKANDWCGEHKGR